MIVTSSGNLAKAGIFRGELASLMLPQSSKQPVVPEPQTSGSGSISARGREPEMWGGGGGRLNAKVPSDASRALLGLQWLCKGATGAPSADEAHRSRKNPAIGWQHPMRMGLEGV